MSSAIEFEQPVARRLVHRASTSEVFPTDFRCIDEDAFLAGVQWPRGHGFYRLAPLDSALVVESIRQLTILTTHLGYGVPAESTFVMPGLGFRIWGDPYVEPGRAVEIAARLSGTNLRRTRDGDVRSGRIRVELMHGGATLVRGYGDVMALTTRQYERVRGSRIGARPTPIRGPVCPAPARIGRTLARDVVVREGLGGLEVVVDPTNPILFDHPVDHVPGVALIESCLQGARLRTGAVAADFAEFSATFRRMVEFDSPNTLEIGVSDECRISISQDAQLCVEASGRLRIA